MTERCDTPRHDETYATDALNERWLKDVWGPELPAKVCDFVNLLISSHENYEADYFRLLREKQDALLAPRSETALTDEKGRPMTYWGGAASPDKPERQVLIDAIGRMLRLHEGHTFDVLAKRIADEVLSLRSAGGRSMREYQERSDLIADFETSTPSATALRELAERCRPAVAHDARLRERDVDSDKYAHTYKPVLKAEAERAAKLLDDIDAILGARSVAPHRSGGPVADGTPKPESASPDSGMPPDNG